MPDAMERSFPKITEEEAAALIRRDGMKPGGTGRMDYAGRVVAHEPTGSGVTKAACKVIVKQRLCGSGMKWTEGGAAVVLSLRVLSSTPERLDQFWSKVDRWGFPVTA